MQQAALTPLEEPDTHDRLIAYWLLGVCLMVYVMLVLGGVTRLTHSGLSMVEWKPLSGWLPPMNEADWQALFDGYRQYPEYQKVNAGMTLAGFKEIFWLEFVHRLWGRVIGLAFALPALLFWARGWVRASRVAGLGWRLWLLLVLGGGQGLLGWYMVKSGLVDNPDVSQYRLTAHLGLAVVIMGYLLWVAMALLRRRDDPPAAGWGPALVAALVFLSMMSGGLVAGLDAGFAYNTFPLMDGGWLPELMWVYEPKYLNFLENIPTVQFTHRLLAMITLLAVLSLWWRRRRAAALDLLAGLAVAQVALGIATLLLVVPVALAAVHQAVAVAVFLAALVVVRANVR